MKDNDKVIQLYDRHEDVFRIHTKFFTEALNMCVGCRDNTNSRDEHKGMFVCNNSLKRIENMEKYIGGSSLNDQQAQNKRQQRKVILSSRVELQLAEY